MLGCCCVVVLNYNKGRMMLVGLEVPRSEGSAVQRALAG